MRFSRLLDPVNPNTASDLVDVVTDECESNRMPDHDDVREAIAALASALLALLRDAETNGLTHLPRPKPVDSARKQP